MDDNTYKRAASDIGASVGEMAGAAKEQATRAVDSAQHVAMDTVGDLEKRIRANPTQSALVAAGLGLMIGMILSR